MKTRIVAFAVAALLCGVSLATAAPREKPTPESSEQGISREDLLATVRHISELAKKQELLLDSAREELTAAHNSENAAEGELKTANKRADSLQVGINTLGKERDAEHAGKLAAESEVAKLKKEIFWFKLPLAICAGGLLVLLFLKFSVPALSPPWGLVTTYAAGPLVFGLIMLL